MYQLVYVLQNVMYFRAQCSCMTVLTAPPHTLPVGQGVRHRAVVTKTVAVVKYVLKW